MSGEQASGEAKDWFLYNKRMKPERLAKLRAYAGDYFEPVLESFPELKGKVSLTVRKEGWFAEYKPRLHIIIRESDLDNPSPWRIRSFTAHELVHLLQFQNGIGVGDRRKVYELQADFLTFAQGFAYDFLMRFPTECKRNPCDHHFKTTYFRCRDLFWEDCKALSPAQLKARAERLETLAQKHATWELRDYRKMVSQCLLDDE